MNTSQLLIRGAFALGLSALALNAPAQVAINTDGSNPDPSAMLDVTSNGKGLLIPRLTNAERDGITTPATGLMIYSTTDESFYYYDGTTWQPVGKAGDNDDTNELQTISLDSDADRIRLSDGGSALMTKYLDNTDNQQLSLANDTLSLSNGGSVDLSSYAADGSPTALTQDLSTAGYWITGEGNPEGGIYIDDQGDAYIGRLLEVDSEGGVPGFVAPGVTVSERLRLHTEYVLGTTPHQRVTYIAHRETIENDVLTESFTDIKTDSETFRFYMDNWLGMTLDRADGLRIHDDIWTADDLKVSDDLNVSGQTNLNGTLTINTGNPTPGQIWTSTGTDGSGSWAAPVRGLAANGVHSTNPNGQGISGNENGWTRVPFYPTDASNLNAGDTVLVIASFRFRINGGSNTDEYSFRVEATNGYSATSTSTGALQDLRDHRGKWQLVTFQRVININTQPSGDVRFYLQVFMSDADDDINVNNLHMTIVKF